MKRAVIVGAGPGGLTATLALCKAGWEVTVCDTARDPSAGGSGLTLWPNAMRALDLLGVGQEVRAITEPFDAVGMNRYDGRPIFRVGRDDGGLDWSVALHRTELQSILAKAACTAAMRWGVRYTNVEKASESVTAVFADGDRVTGDVLVGADGLRSRVREEVGKPPPLRDAGFRVWRGVAEFALRERLALTTMGRGAQFGLFPMSGGRVYWFASLNTALASPGGEDSKALQRAFAGWHEPIQAVIEATDPEKVIVTDIHDREPVTRWSSGRVVLLGDAAHPSVPTLGQGACQAIEDGVTLGRCLRDTSDIAGAICNYEQKRVGRANRMTDQAWRIGKVGQWTNGVACQFRDWLIHAMPESARRSQLRAMFEFHA